MSAKLLRETGFVLHHFPYSDQAAILACLLEESGRVDFIVRNFYGSRRAKSPSQRLELFQPIEFEWQVKPNAALQSIKSFSYLKPQIVFWSGEKLALGYYFNELYYRLIKPQMPASDLFHLYQHAIHALHTLDDAADGVTTQRLLRSLELAFLRLLGYELCVDGDAQSAPFDPQAHYVFDLEQGYIRHAQGILGAHLAQQQPAEMSPEALKAWRGNCRFVFDQLLDFRPLKSRKIYQDLLKYKKGTPHA